MTGSKLTYPKLDLTTAPEVYAYRAIVKVLQTDPVFKPVINTWVVWDGSNVDNTEPAYSMCPFCRVSPFPSEANPITESQHSMPMTIRVLLAVAGTDFDQIANLWHAMRSSFWPQNNPTRRALVEEIIASPETRVTRPKIMIAAYGERTEESGAKFMIADGTIQFGMLIPT